MATVLVPPCCLLGQGGTRGSAIGKELQLQPPAMAPPWRAGLSAATQGAGLETLVLGGLRPDPPFSRALAAHGISVL